MRAPVLLAVLLLAACKGGIPKVQVACVARDDCALTDLGDDCCFGCESLAANLSSIAARTAWCAKKPNDSPCPVAKCRAQSITAYCLEDRCQVRGL